LVFLYRNINRIYFFLCKYTHLQTEIPTIEGPTRRKKYVLDLFLKASDKRRLIYIIGSESQSHLLQNPDRVSIYIRVFICVYKIYTNLYIPLRNVSISLAQSCVYIVNSQICHQKPEAMSDCCT